MTSADIALAAFTACNSVRILAYVPQIVRIGRDTDGAAAISYSTWVLFALSHLSTVAYALAVVDDPRMAAVFAGNAACCLAIPILTACKRARHARGGILRGQPADGAGNGPAPIQLRQPAFQPEDLHHDAHVSSRYGVPVPLAGQRLARHPGRRSLHHRLPR